MSKWISVKDRLPEPMVLVLLYVEGTFTLGSYDPEKGPEERHQKLPDWYHDLDDPDAIPTHWQPLPEPPEETDCGEYELGAGWHCKPGCEKHK